MLPTYEKTQRTPFSPLPKGAYVCVIKGAQILPNKNGNGQHIEISFDIAEGEYKGFYAEQYKANLNEDKVWSYDARYNLNIPHDGCENWVWQKYNDFLSDLEDSNDGYVCKDERTMKGKVFGGKFRIEQTEKNGNIYNHTKLAWTCTADAVRQGKAGRMPNDKMYTPPHNDGFMDIPGSADDDGLPFN